MDVVYYTVLKLHIEMSRKWQQAIIRQNLMLISNHVNNKTIYSGLAARLTDHSNRECADRSKQPLCASSVLHSCTNAIKHHVTVSYVDEGLQTDSSCFQPHAAVCQLIAPALPLHWLQTSSCETLANATEGTGSSRITESVTVMYNWKGSSLLLSNGSKRIPPPSPPAF